MEDLGYGAGPTGDAATGTRRIQAEFDGGTVVYRPNDRAAADAPLVQLSLTTEAEDYSTNEKIFYPPQCWTPQIPRWPRAAPAPRPTTPPGETR